MCDTNVVKPLYFQIADWMMAQNRWVSAGEIARQFGIEHCKAINTVSYILGEVAEIECETRTIPNQLEGRGCQCQRQVRVRNIDAGLYARFKKQEQQSRSVASGPRLTPPPPENLDVGQKWQWMMSKSQRRERVQDSRE